MLNYAIEYVTADYIPTFYFVSGHGENDTKEGALDITQLSSLPPDASMLFINAPTSDYSASEVDMLIDYMAKGGRLVIFTNENNNDMPNLSRLLASAGLSVDKNIAVEETCKVTINTSADPLAMLASGDKKVTINMEGASAIAKDNSNGALKYATLFSREITNEGSDEKTTVEYGVAVTNNARPMLVWVTGADTFNKGNDEMLSEDESVNYSKAMYTVSSIVLWSSKIFESTVAAPTPGAYDMLEFLTIKESTPTVVGTVFVAIVPIFIFGAGLYLWWVRRKRSTLTE